MGFISKALSAQNEFRAQPANLQQTQFGGMIQDAYAQQQAQNQQQSGLAGQLQQAALGKGPSIAQQQLGQALGQAQNTAASQMAGARGLNPALAARLIGQNQAAQAQGAAGQSAMLKFQEQMAARQELANLLANQRAGNINMYSGATGAQGQQNATNVQNQLGAQQINAGIAAQNQAAQNQITGGLLGGVASAGMLGAMGGFGGGAAATGATAGGAGSGLMNTAAMMNAAGTMAPKFSQGGHVGGKEIVSGDSPKNDNVPAMLSAGEIVIPKSAATSKERAKEFIEHLMSNEKESAEPKSGYARVVHYQKQLENRLAKIEAMFGGGYV